MKKLVDFKKKVSIEDADGVSHRFEISNMIMPGLSKWRAEEMKGGYQFEVMARPEEDQEMAVRSLHLKIAEGMGYKTLRPLPDTYPISNAICVAKKQYSLQSVGTFRIEQDGEDTVNLIIDGKAIPLEEFGRALIGFGGFNMDYQVRDQSDEVLGEAMALKPVKIDPEDILWHFQRTLGWFLERGFLSYKLERGCVEALVERISELEFLYNYGERDEAVEVGKKMKERLLTIDHASEDFPEMLLQLIDEVTGFPE